MPDIKLPKLIDVKKIDNAIQKALEIVYVNELTIRTPKKTGITSGSWSSHSLGNFEYSITNPYGDIIIFLEEGTKAHDILPKTKKMLKFQIDKRPVFNAKNPRDRKRIEKQFNEKGFVFFFNRKKEAVLGYSKEGSRYFVYVKKVRHPGTRGKFFIKEILEDENLFKRFENYILKFLK